MSYLKQKKWYDCAPTALVNAYIFLGYKVNKVEKYKEFSDLLKLKKDYGTNQRHFHKVVRSLFPKLKKKNGPTIEDLNSPCILSIDADWCHVGLLIKSTKHYFYLVNWGKEYPLIRKVRKDTLKKSLNRRTVAYLLDVTIIS